jgi:signal recognition particle receptor subunit beta
MKLYSCFLLSITSLARDLPMSGTPDDAAGQAAEGSSTAAEAVIEPAVSPTAGLAAGVDTATLAASLLLPLLLVLFLFTRRSAGGARGRKLVIFGPVGAGKSALLHRLQFGRVVPTVSSMLPANEVFAPVGLDVKPANIVDVPGSGRLRAQLLEEASSASALVCVIDGTQLAVQAREAAGMLFEVLSHEAVLRSQPPLLIAVNKQDCAGAATTAAARKAIEQEVQRVRLARTTMQDTSGREKQLRGIAGGSPDSPFSFDELDNAFVVAGTSVTKPELSPVLDMISALR